MANFVLNRIHNLIERGHNIRFEKGQPTYVPPELHKSAIAIGADPVDTEVDMGGDEEGTTVQLTPEERKAEFIKVFDKLVATNDREDFDASGTPTFEKLRAMLPFSISKKERNTAWQEYVASKEA
jgi:hypothetical protein